jgi:hypothetical protein
VSHFACPICKTICYDTPDGYVTGCEHYPADINEDAACDKPCGLEPLACAHCGPIDFMGLADRIIRVEICPICGAELTRTGCCPRGHGCDMGE